MFKNIFYIAVIFFTFSCNTKQSKNTTEIPVEIKKQVVAEKIKPKYERLPMALAQKIFNECNGIDGTFYNSSKSVSLWDDNVKHILTMITSEAPLVLDNNLIGHLMMLKDGNQMAFVEISMKDGNNYVIYNIDDKKYYNSINAKGVQFFSKFLKD